MPTIETIERCADGTMPAHAWPGGYPLVYVLADGATLCPVCANGGNRSDAFTADSRPPLVPHDADAQWCIVGADVHWEGPPMSCDHCNAEIESACGDPDAPTDTLHVAE